MPRIFSLPSRSFKRMTGLIIFCLAHVLAGFSQQPFSARVVGISDGDTFTVLNEDKQTLKIRLHGIDCPEKGQPFGSQAKAYLSSLIFRKTVSIRSAKKDKYGRVLAIVLYDGNNNLNEAMLSAGYAWHFKKYDKNANWAALEKQARTAKKGLWNDTHPIAPWEWRDRSRVKRSFSVF